MAVLLVSVEREGVETAREEGKGRRRKGIILPAYHVINLPVGHALVRTLLHPWRLFDRQALEEGGKDRDARGKTTTDLCTFLSSRAGGLGRAEGELGGKIWRQTAWNERALRENAMGCGPSKRAFEDRK